MEPIRVDEILKACAGKLIIRDNMSIKEKKIHGISTDTRTIKKGDLFIALKGKNFDGHDFIRDAFLKEACGVLISEDKKFGTDLINRSNHVINHQPKFLIKVKDTLSGLQDIASYYKSKFNVTTIGITGSNGKTTVKEITYHSLSKKYKALKNKGNFNNEIGVPLTLFDLNKEHKVLVLEFATNNFGEIRRLAEIAKPKIGCLLNVGLTHTEFLKDINGVSKAKQELIETLPQDGIAILNSDDENVIKMKTKAKCRYLTFGINNESDIFASQIEDMKEAGMKFKLNLNNKSIKIWIRLIGMHNVYNSLAAVSCSYVCGLSLNEIKSSLESFTFSLPGRWNILIKKRIKIIDDSYNANPDSMKAAINTFLNLNNARSKKILVLGDMLELGEGKENMHRRIGNIIGNISKKKEILLFTFGNLANEIGLGAKETGFKKENIFSSNDKKELGNCIRKIIKPGDSVLIKGSNAMKMEEIISAISSTVSVT